MSVIHIDGNLTSYSFYNDLLIQLKKNLNESNCDNLIIDFSETRYIDPLVIPNLLCVGYLLGKHYGQLAKIRIPNNYDHAPLKTFMNNSDFVSLAKYYGLYDFDEDISGGLIEAKRAGNPNRTVAFQIDLDMNDTTEYLDEYIHNAKQNEWAKLRKAFTPFLKKYLFSHSESHVDDGEEALFRKILSFNWELAENALFHGNSFCFINMQYTSQLGKKINISVSDCGIGFRRSINEARERSLKIRDLQSRLEHCKSEQEEKQLSDDILRLKREKYPLNEADITRLAKTPYIENELQGIAYGLLSRSDEPYGLYNVHKAVCSRGGTIRIHSNNTQVILSERTGLVLDAYKGNPEKLIYALTNEYKANVRTNLKFRGVHTEIEFYLD